MSQLPFAESAKYLMQQQKYGKLCEIDALKGKMTRKKQEHHFEEESEGGEEIRSAIVTKQNV